MKILMSQLRRIIRETLEWEDDGRDIYDDGYNEDVLVINNETGEIIGRFAFGTSREGALEVVANDMGFTSIQDARQQLGDGWADHLAVERNGLEVEDVEPY